MKDTFNFRRMGLLIHKHWLENRRRYLIGAAAYTVILLIVYITTYSNISRGRVDSAESYRAYVQFASYGPCLLIGGIVYAGLMFTDYTRKESGVFNLLVPASSLEKALVLIFFGIVMYWIVFTLVFWVVDFIALVAIGRLTEFQIFNPFVLGSYDDLSVAGIHAGYVVLQTLFILGNVYFRRFAFFKTVLAAAALFIFFMTMVYKVGYRRAGPDDTNFVSVWRSDWVRADESSDYNTTTVTAASLSTGEKTIFYSIGIIGLLGFWAAISMRIKEKEI